MQRSKSKRQCVPLLFCAQLATGRCLQLWHLSARRPSIVDMLHIVHMLHTPLQAASAALRHASAACCLYTNTQRRLAASS